MTIHGFTLRRDEDIAEYNLRAQIYRHDKTGAELLSIINRDENKVFGITFRTPPWDSTGVAHILEHSVLCGSRKFPVKEPFVELLKGSLQTFLNAFTYPDKTCYPVASQNLRDFYNLIDIYMDAALHPLLEKHTFEQEAWHYELNHPDEPLIYKGVVFNEMKGVYASADALLGEHSQRVLYPDITYGLDYGGDPRHIPELTWDQLRAFHKKYYHPSNARIFFYGDDDPTERLRLMDAYLSEYEYQKVDSLIPLQPDTRKLPAKVILPFPAGEQNDALGHVTVNWRLGEGTDVEETLGLHLLDHILTETTASPLRNALIDSGLGEDLAGAGLETQIRQLYFSTGMKGVRPGDEDKVVALIEQTLADLATHGIDPKTIESSINTEEFHFRELNTGSYPRGLSLMLTALQTWLYGGDPLAPIRYQQPLSSIKQRLASGERYFEGLIKKWLMDNPHRTLLALLPDTDLKNRLDREEAERLAAVKKSWSNDTLNDVVRHTEALKKRQATPDDPEALLCLPGLARADLDKANKPLPIEVSTLDDVPFLFHDLFTQGISYLDVGFNLQSIPEDLLGLLPVWTRALLETGTAQENYVELSQRIGRETGGIQPEFYATHRVTGEGGINWLFLRGKAMDERLPDLLRILDDVLSGARLDLRDRVKQIIAEEKSELESGLIPSGHRFVGQRLRARFLEQEWVQEKLGGVSYLLTLRELMEQVDQDWPSLHHKLKTIHDLLSARSNLLVNLTATGPARSQAESHIKVFLANRNASTIAPAARDGFSFQPREPEVLIIPAQVNYVGKSINLKQHGIPVTGHSLVVNRYIRTAWLWDQVRVQGGAYGGFSTLDYRSGQLVMVSYRDPNLAKTLEIYDRTSQYLKELALDEAELNRAIIGAIGDMDGYLLPDAKGFISMGRHLAGDSEENRQRLRDQVLATEIKHFHEFGEQLEAMASSGQVVVMGSGEQLQALPKAVPTPVL